MYFLMLIVGKYRCNCVVIFYIIDRKNVKEIIENMFNYNEKIVYEINIEKF